MSSDARLGSLWRTACLTIGGLSIANSMLRERQKVAEVAEEVMETTYTLGESLVQKLAGVGDSILISLQEKFLAPSPLGSFNLPNSAVGQDLPEQPAVRVHDQRAKYKARKRKGAKKANEGGNLDYEPDGEEVQCVRRPRCHAPAKETPYTDEASASDDDDGDDLKMRKRSLTLTLQRIDGRLGIAVAGNQVTAVHAGGAGAVAGLEIGDVVTEVNGKDTHLDSLGSLLSKDEAKPMKLRIQRFFMARPPPPPARPPATLEGVEPTADARHALSVD